MRDDFSIRCCHVFAAANRGYLDQSLSGLEGSRSGLRPIPVHTATVFEAPRQAPEMPLLPTLMMCPLGRSSPPPIRLPRPTGSLTWHGSRTPAREADITDPATFRTGIQGLSTQIQALIRKSQQRDQISEIVPCPRSAAPPLFLTPLRSPDHLVGLDLNDHGVEWRSGHFCAGVILDEELEV